MKQTAVVEFDELKAAISEMIAPTLEIRVSDFKSSQSAIETVKQVKDYLNRVEKKRKELVGPLNDRVREINDYAKLITAPLLKSETHIKAQLVVFEQEQEKVREAERKRLEEGRRREEDALRAKQEAERQAVAEEAEDDLFGAAAESVQELEQKHAEEQARIKNEIALKHYDIEQRGIKNSAKKWCCEVSDITKVPKEFLVVSLNEKAVLAAARAGVKEIAGVRIWQETTIRVGRNTYVPEAALIGEGSDD